MHVCRDQVNAQAMFNEVDEDKNEEITYDEVSMCVYTFMRRLSQSRAV